MHLNNVFVFNKKIGVIIDRGEKLVKAIHNNAIHVFLLNRDNDNVFKLIIVWGDSFLFAKSRLEQYFIGEPSRSPDNTIKLPIFGVKDRTFIIEQIEQIQRTRRYV